MPIAKSNLQPARQALMIGLGALAVIGVLVYLAKAISGETPEVSLTLSDSAISLGSAKSNAEQIATSGPTLWGDLAGGSHNLYLSHTGATPRDGWHGVSIIPSKGSGCELQVDTERNKFVDCDGNKYPLSGEGLGTYTVAVTDSGNLIVDLATLKYPTDS